MSPPVTKHGESTGDDPPRHPGRANPNCASASLADDGRHDRSVAMNLLHLGAHVLKISLTFDESMTSPPSVATDVSLAKSETAAENGHVRRRAAASLA